MKWVSLQSIFTGIVVQFGPHFAKNIAPLKSYFSADPGWEINATKWGLLQTAVSVPCALFPWIVGHYVDRVLSARMVLFLSLLSTCIGQLVFIIATMDHLFDYALVGRFVFGIGEGLTSSLPGFIAVRYIPHRKMFAIGLTASFHALAVGLSKASLAPVANAYSYVTSLELSLLMCFVSLVVGSCCMPANKPENTPHQSYGRPGILPLDFWLVSSIHLLFSSAHRLFGHIDAAFLQEKLGQSASVSGYISSIAELVAVIVAPILGIVLDKYCSLHTLPTLLLGTAVTGTVAYGILGLDNDSLLTTETCLVLIGIVNGITPTVMKSVVAESVHGSMAATAFGIYESAESFGVIVGSVLIGIAVERASEHYQVCVPVFSSLLAIASLISLILLIRRHRAFVNSRPDPFQYCQYHDLNL